MGLPSTDTDRDAHTRPHTDTHTDSQRSTHGRTAINAIATGARRAGVHGLRGQPVLAGLHE